jgi:hypothetical protein
LETAAKIDEILGTGKRSLRTMPKSCLLGPTGARLWADVLNPEPGFAGTIDFIHKLNIPLLYTIKTGRKTIFEPVKVQWYPSHLAMEHTCSELRFSEKKFITWDDCAVSCQTWENTGDREIVLQLATDMALLQEHSGGQLIGVFPVPQYDFGILTVLTVSRPELMDGLVLKPQERAEIVLCASLGVDGADQPSELRERSERFTRTQASLIEIVAEQQKTYQSWFDKAPSFVSNERLLNKTWHYRWFLLRHNLADPQCGSIQAPLFYEGRSHKMTKTPFDPKGWEFSKMIPLTVPMHLLEARWYSDDSYASGAFRNMKESQDEEGFYRCLFVNKTLHSYSNFMGWAAYQWYLVHRDDKLLAEMLPSLKRQIIGEGKKLGNAKDKLITEYTHNRTGKEYQPSYWYFHDFPKDCKDPNTFTPLKRVDRSIYHYLNSLGVAELCKAAGDPEAELYSQLAEELRSDILHKMWDEDSKFFYDLHYENDEKAMVKNIVGFYPYWAQITDAEHDAGLLHAFVDKEFNTPCPFPSVSADCPAYQPEGGWQGIFIKGRNGCVWDGPTWPYTNSIVLDALALESKRRNHPFDERFGHYLREYSMLHYSHRDLDKPYLVEHYNSQTGEALSDEVDYNHSYYIDLIVKHVVGLNIETDRIVLDPVDIGLDFFELDRIRVDGRQIRVTFHQRENSMPRGYRLYVDDHLVLVSDGLKRMEYPLKAVKRNNKV